MGVHGAVCVMVWRNMVFSIEKALLGCPGAWLCCILTVSYFFFVVVLSACTAVRHVPLLSYGRLVGRS